MDITHLAVALMKNRLKTAFDLEPRLDYDVVGEPQDAGSARALWKQDPYQFQFWAVSLLEAQPQQEQRRGADRGVDGMLYFLDGPRRTPHKVVIQVKGGHVSSPQIRDLKGVVEREKAALGLFISLEDPTQGHAHGGCQRRAVPLRPVGPGLPQDTDSHRGGDAGRKRLRVAAASGGLPTRPAGPPLPRPPTPNGGPRNGVVGYKPRSGLKLTALSAPFLMASRNRRKSTVSNGVSAVTASNRAASVRPSLANAGLDEAVAPVTTISWL